MRDRAAGTEQCAHHLQDRLNRARYIRRLVIIPPVLALMTHYCACVHLCRPERCSNVRLLKCPRYTELDAASAVPRALFLFPSSCLSRACACARACFPRCVPDATSATGALRLRDRARPARSPRALVRVRPPARPPARPAVPAAFPRLRPPLARCALRARCAPWWRGCCLPWRAATAGEEKRQERRAQTQRNTQARRAAQAPAAAREGRTAAGRALARRGAGAVVGYGR